MLPPRFDRRPLRCVLGNDSNGTTLAYGPHLRRPLHDATLQGAQLVLETESETPTGAIRVVDCMPPRGVAPDLVRVVEGVRGRVSVTSELRTRCDYGHVAPWVTIEGT